MYGYYFNFTFINPLKTSENCMQHLLLPSVIPPYNLLVSYDSRNKELTFPQIAVLGGVTASVLAIGRKVRDKSPQHAFLWRNKAVGPM
jgi:hypothetical protein